MQNKTHNDFIIKTSPNGDKTILYAYLGSESVISVPAGVTDIDKCIGCAFCAMICPDCAIEVKEWQ